MKQVRFIELLVRVITFRNNEAGTSHWVITLKSCTITSIWNGYIIYRKRSKKFPSAIDLHKLLVCEASSAICFWSGKTYHKMEICTISMRAWTVHHKKITKLGIFPLSFDGNCPLCACIKRSDTHREIFSEYFWI